VLLHTFIDLLRGYQFRRSPFSGDTCSRGGTPLALAQGELLSLHLLYRRENVLTHAKSPCEPGVTHSNRLVQGVIEPVTVPGNLEEKKGLT